MFSKSVIFEIGLHEMKIGFTGDEIPRFRQRSLIGYPLNPATLIFDENVDSLIGDKAIQKEEVVRIKYPLLSNREIDWELFENLMHSIIYEQLRIKYNEFPLYIIINNFFDNNKRKKLIDIIFENFDFPSVYFISSNVAGIFFEGRTNGVVLDSGYSQTNCVSIFEGYPILDNIQFCEFGGRNAENILRTEIEEILNSEKDNFKTISDFNRLYGYEFSSIYYEILKERILEENKGDFQLVLPDNNKICIDDQRLIKIYRHFEDSFTDLICLTLKNMDGCIMENLDHISIIGGNTILPGIEEKIISGLNKNNFDLNVLLKTNGEKKNASWIGCSLLGCIEASENLLIKKSEYAEIGSDAILKKNLL